MLTCLSLFLCLLIVSIVSRVVCVKVVSMSLLLIFHKSFYLPCCVCVCVCVLYFMFSVSFELQVAIICFILCVVYTIFVRIFFCCLSLGGSFFCASIRLDLPGYSNLFPLLKLYICMYGRQQQPSRHWRHSRWQLI